VVSKVMLEDWDSAGRGNDRPDRTGVVQTADAGKGTTHIDWVLVVIGILAGLVVLIIIMYLIIRRVRRVGRPFDSG